MTIGIVFSGQGSQKTGMGYDLYQAIPEVKKFYDTLTSEQDIKNISFSGDKDLLKKTKYTQPVLVAFQLAILGEIERMNLPISLAAGISLGEFSALVAAEMISCDECLPLIEKRADLMSIACRQPPSILIAILGQTYENVQKFQGELKRKDIPFEIANYNTPTEIVIGCEERVETTVVQSLEAAGIFHKKLNVEGAFHTSYMSDAAHEFKKELQTIQFKKPKINIASNFTGELYGDDDPVQLLSSQMDHMTHFKNTIDWMKEHDIRYVLEIGFNNIIKKMLRRNAPDIEVIPVKDVESLEKLRKLSEEERFLSR